MTEERDEAVSRRYRELGAEEPPRALDDAILAAARRPARTSTRRWAVPSSLAAVVVLSVTVTLNIQREAPEMVPAQAPARPMSAPTPAPQAAAPEAKQRGADASQQEAAKAAGPSAARETPAEAPRSETPAQKPFAPDPPAVADASPRAPAESAAPAPAIASRAERDSAAVAGALSAPRQEAREDQVAERARTAPAPAAMAKRMQVQETPEQELERIALLRREGKHDEADKALADFRKRRPEFRIPEATLERVEKR